MTKLTAREFMDAWDNNEFETNIIMSELFEDGDVEEDDIIIIDDENNISSETNKVEGVITSGGLFQKEKKQ